LGYLLDRLDPLATGEENPGEMPVWEGLICDACGDHVIDPEEAVVWQEDRSIICPDAAPSRMRVRFMGDCACGDRCRVEMGHRARRCARCLGTVR
jgi:hypothetical protein